MTEGERDHFGSWQLAIAAERIKLKAGRPLTPREIIAAIDLEAEAMKSTSQPQFPAGSVPSLVLAVLHCEARRIIREWPAEKPGACGRYYVPADPAAHARAVAALRQVNERILAMRRK